MTHRGDIPEKIDRYEIIEAIGYGAMGAVYKAFDPIIQRPVAVKTLRLDVPPGSPDYQAFIERFKSEAKSVGRLSHPNVVTLYDVGRTAEEVPWLAMEYVDGQTIAELLERERLRPEFVITLVSQIASAIDYAHTEGVVHRDIKPSNVIVFAGEKVKVTDFGIAKLMDADVTHSGITTGTPSYMSPEQAMGEDLDGRTDIFSLGVVAFEMLSGQQPFPGNNVTSILYKLVHADPVHPDDLEVLGLLPNKWHEVFSKVLAKDPAERYSTAGAFVQDLELCLGSWFGALEGETVIIKDKDALAKEAAAAAGATRVEEAPDADQTVMLENPRRGEPAPSGDEAEETIRIETSPLASRPPLDPDATMAGGLPASGEGGLTGEAVRVPPPGDAERTLYVGADLDATVTDPESATPETLVDAPPLDSGENPDATLMGDADETLVGAPEASPAPEPATATIRRRSPFAAKYAPVLIGILVAALVGAVLFLRGPAAGPEAQPEPAPEPAEPVVSSEPAALPEMGSLSVATEPAGARVFLDEREAGVAPIDFPSIPMSTYGIRVELDGYLPEEVTADLTPEAPDASFDLELRSAPRAPRPAFMRILSEPTGARVEIDGRTIGNTPVERVQVAPGARAVRLMLDGYLPWEDSVRAAEGRTELLEAVLTPRGPVAPDEPEEVEPEPPVDVVTPGQLVERGELGVLNPECIRCPTVPYPPAARQARLEGLVELDYLIDENGEVRDIRLQQSGGDIFDSAVLEGVRQWRYRPATKHGVPVQMRWTQRFRFQLGR